MSAHQRIGHVCLLVTLAFSFGVGAPALAQCNPLGQPAYLYQSTWALDINGVPYQLGHHGNRVIDMDQSIGFSPAFFYSVAQSPVPWGSIQFTQFGPNGETLGLGNVTISNGSVGCANLVSAMPCCGIANPIAGVYAVQATVFPSGQVGQLGNTNLIIVGGGLAVPPVGNQQFRIVGTSTTNPYSYGLSVDPANPVMVLMPPLPPGSTGAAFANAFAASINAQVPPICVAAAVGDLLTLTPVAPVVQFRFWIGNALGVPKYQATGRTVVFNPTMTYLGTNALPAVVLPDNHHLCESATQDGTSGSYNWWGTTTTGRRFQVLYEASHFTGTAGVAGPTVLSHLMFLGEDNEKNTGGQTYTGVTVTIAKTTLTSTTMATTFANNLLPGVTSTTTTIGTVAIPVLTVAPSLGGAPNSPMIDIDLTTGLPVIFDPVTDPLGEVNLLVDIVWTGYANGPAIPPATATIPMIPTGDTAPHGAGIRGRGVYAATPGAATGTNSASPPRMIVELGGHGGYATLIPARTEYIGASCSGSVPSTSGFYQSFTTTNPCDLGGSGFTLTPDSPLTPTSYTVTAGAGPFDATRVNAVANSTADDGIVTWALGYTFNYPGGSTTTIKPVTNGFVWLDAAMTSTDFAPALSKWLSQAGTSYFSARFAPFWHDFDASENTVTHSGSGLHVLNDTTGGPGNTVTYVTWDRIGEFTTVTGGGQSVNSMQLVLHEATGVVEFRYGTLQNLTGSSPPGAFNGITGFTRGRIGGSTGVGSLDPRSRDLSHELPFSTNGEVAANPHITANSLPLLAAPEYGARMFGGQTLTFQVWNVPAGTLLMLVNLDLAASMPGIQVPTITAPGCMISTGPSPVLLGWELALFPPTTFVGTVPLVVPDIVWNGLTVTAQAMEIDISGGPNLIKWASDTMKFTVGLD